ncbi:MAG: RIP metalloprotease RseP [Deltaproteobacteria bacterium]|nr:MAG: RIP metalloprotease RseP [Deltaproteobacteria bacterium]
MITVVAGIIMLGILVFVHELGHFCVAKWFGVKVLKFSLGFGPKLVSRQWGETEYLICAVPLGGYVQMLGEGNGDQGEGAELTPEDEHRSFARQTVGRRMAIVAAGPIMNLALPFLILPLAYLVGVNLPAYLDQPPCIGYVIADSEGAHQGFRSGDCIKTVGGTPVATWESLGPALINHAGVPLPVVVERGGELVTLTLPVDHGALEGLQAIGLLPRQEAVVGSFAPDMPAAAAGLQIGDLIVAIDDRPVGSWYDLRTLIQEVGDRQVPVRVLRDGRELTLTMTPRQAEKGGDYLIGIAPHHATTFKRFGPIEAFRAGSARTMELIELTLVFIRKMFAGAVPTSNIGGPITVVQIAGQAAQTDLSSILSVLAFLSIQLGILNLLPIPILDGGHLFFACFELILRRPLSLKTREIAQQIGLALLILLMVLAFYNDIMRLFGS